MTDTETMLAILEKAGWAITQDPADADAIVVNTCAFIDSAKEESINAVLDMAQYKKQKLNYLIVAGCLSQRYKEQVLEEFPEADAVVGVNDYGEIARVLEELKSGNRPVLVRDCDAHETRNLPRKLTTPSHYAYLKIADGCDNHCTYCIIPKLRGRYESRREDDIVKEAEQMAKQGVKELILVAQDTAYYGRDGDGDLPRLLRRLSEIPGIAWIRMQYCYPEHISDALILEMAQNKKIVPYLDMPIQHVSDSVLKRMGRKSRKAELLALIKALREKVPGIVLRTSLIVGFPGETEAEFLELVDFLRTVSLDKVGVFPYSREEGTAAYAMDGQVAETVKKQRYETLMAVQKEVSQKINQKKIGTLMPVIIEGYDWENLCYVGRTYGDTPEVDGAAYVYSASELEIGGIVSMRVLEAGDYDVTGEVQDESSK